LSSRPPPSQNGQFRKVHLAFENVAWVVGPRRRAISEPERQRLAKYAFSPARNARETAPESHDRGLDVSEKPGTPIAHQALFCRIWQRVCGPVSKMAQDTWNGRGGKTVL